MELFLPKGAPSDGYKQRTLTIEFAEGRLSVSGGCNTLGGDYRLEAQVPEKVDVNRIGATVQDGILLLTLPIREAAKPRVIEID